MIFPSFMIMIILHFVQILKYFYLIFYYKYSVFEILKSLKQ